MNESMYFRNMFPKLENNVQSTPVKDEIKIDRSASNFALRAGGALVFVVAYGFGVFQYDMSHHPQKYRAPDVREQTTKANAFLAGLGFLGIANLLGGTYLSHVETQDALRKSQNRNRRYQLL